MVCDLLLPTGGQASDNKDTALLSSDLFLFKGVWLHRSATNPCGVKGTWVWGEVRCVGGNGKRGGYIRTAKKQIRLTFTWVRIPRSGLQCVRTSGLPAGLLIYRDT